MNKSCYKISLTDKWPQYYLNFAESIDTTNLCDSEVNKIITEILLKEYKGKYYDRNNRIQSLEEYDEHMAGVVFENTEDALAFILKWS